MGVHISVYRVKDMKSHEFTEISKELDFDTLRYEGDKQFCECFQLWESITCGNTYCCDYFMTRPKDFKETKTWVKNNIYESNQKRLLDVLEQMENDKELYFYFGY